ncbi:hypothetical protein [Malaciobacter marinus]|nr:hypothetical protein [Malaciobacter marinus]
MKRTIVAVVITFLFLASFSTATIPKNFSQEKFNEFTKKYGKKASKRVLLWDDLIESAKDKKLLYKLKMVNDFFNKIPYKLDSIH